jgi:hypothetical protein
MAKIPGLAAQLARAKRALKKVRPGWRRRKGVVGLGVGIKVSQGQSAERVAIQVYVAAKLGEDALRENQVFPQSVGGVPVDVVPVTGRHIGNGSTQSGQRLFAQSTPGNQGTLGLVLRRLGNADSWFLTCAHLAPAGQNMFRVGLASRIGVALPNTAAQINRRLTPRLDWAAIQAADPAPAPMVMGVAGAARPYGLGTVDIGDEVFRTDAGGAHVRGRVTGLEVPIDLGGNPLVAAIQVAAIGAGPFTQPGDSGAMLLKRNGSGTDFVGLLFAEFLDNHGNHEASAACGFDEIDAELQTDYPNT